MMDFVVDGPTTLAALRQRGVKGTIRRINLAGPLADERTERALNDAYFSCGCAEGSVAVMMVLIGSLALGLLRGFEGALAWWYVALYVACAAVAGKLFGLARARVRLRFLYHQLEKLDRPPVS